MAKAQAFLIDPVAQSITEVTYTGHYTNIYTHLGIDTFTVVDLGFDNGDAVFVDDEGLLKSDQRFFQIDGYPQPIAGRGLVLGTDEEGESVTPKITLSKLKGLISWVRPDLELQGFEPIPEDTVIHDPILGDMPVIGHTPVFGFKKREDKE